MTLSPTSPSAALAATLPGRYYTQPDIFALEQEKIFERHWVYIGRAADVRQPGQFLRADVGTENVIVVAGADGRLRGFLNVCRHRGAMLCAEDSGNVGKALRCPYHAWTYRLDGTLVAAPNWRAIQHIDRADYSLRPVAVDVWEGLVWVNLAAEPAPLADQLRTQIEYRLGDYAQFARYDLGGLVLGGRKEYVCAANWKLIFENFQECYHCGTIHPELCDTIPRFADPATFTHGYDHAGYEFSEDHPGFTLSGAVRIPRLPLLTDDDDRRYYGMVVRPNAFISLTPDHVIVHRFVPIAPDRTTVVCEWLFHPDVLEAGIDVTDSIELFHKVNQQDLSACEITQPNMTSRGYRDGGVLVPAEEALISRFREWILESLER